ncbi:MAG: RNA polymerase sporulation sigma factor SigK [Lachnospiraceae bacterium]|nr:RNA polymerase sporulation sigma factor SigK [Robinsoniella sp.]MDY3766181.1 RNA polymerase sporulation sigma factor SigK [Lachnospiraceae bacterium]
MKTFPKPLTAQEERQYLQQYQEGDMEAKKVLIERNLRLVAHVAKKYQGAEEDNDDLISIGTIGLIKAVSTFDPTKNNRLATYAAKCIENELLMMFRMRKKMAKEVSLYDPIGTDKEGNEISLFDIIEGENIDIIEEMELENNVRRLHHLLEEVLDEREKKVIRMRYGVCGAQEMTQREIAKMLGISRSYVSRIEKNALEKLKGQF